MKIAFVTGSFPKLSETFVLDQITGLIELGHEVEIFAFESTSESVRHAAVERYRLAERTTLLDREPRGVVRGALASLPDVGRWIAGVRDRDALRTRFTHGRRGAFDVVYCHFGHVAERARRLRRAGFFDGPLVAVFHAYDLAIWPRLRGPGCYRELFAEAARLLPITEHWRRRLVELGATDEKIEVRRLGIDLGTFGFRERTAGPGETLAFVGVGRLVEKKGFGLAIEAFARARSRMPPFTFDIVGDGPLRAELEALARRCGLSDLIVFHGDKARDDVAALLDAKHVFVAPSVTAANGDTEGLPMVLIEAMARGLPVVTTAHSGIPELVRDGETGFVVPEGDAGALGDALLEAALHAERWPALARSARRVVEERHDGTRLVGELAGLFENLARPLSSRGRAASRP